MTAQGKIKILHLINSYAFAGAEKLVFDLVARMDRERFEVLVCSIGNREDEIEGRIRKELESKGVTTLSLGKPPRKRRARAIWKLRRYLKENHVDILHTTVPRRISTGKLPPFSCKHPWSFPLYTAFKVIVHLVSTFLRI